jgi:ABC-type transporter Mla subunit MlaD
MTEEKKGRGRPRKNFQTSVDLATVEAQVAPTRAEAVEQLAQLSSWEPTSQEDIAFAGSLLANVRQRADAFEEQRLTVAAPLTQASKALNALCKPAADVFEAMDELLVGKIVGYLGSALERQEAALKAQEAGDRSPEVTALAHATPALPEGFSELVTYDVEAIDIALVPKELLQLNAPLAKAYVKERKGQVQIPGVKVTAKIGLRRTGGA